MVYHKMLMIVIVLFSTYFLPVREFYVLVQALMWGFYSHILLFDFLFFSIFLFIQFLLCFLFFSLFLVYGICVLFFYLFFFII